MNQTMYNPSKDLLDNCAPTELDDFWRMRLLQGEVHDERANRKISNFRPIIHDAISKAVFNN